MPYIAPERRPEMDQHIDPLVDKLLYPGDFAYIIFRLMVRMWRKHPKWVTYALMEGDAQGALREFYRRYAGPHEDKKSTENGDI